MYGRQVVSSASTAASVKRRTRRELDLFCLDRAPLTRILLRIFFAGDRQVNVQCDRKTTECGTESIGGGDAGNATAAVLVLATSCWPLVTLASVFVLRVVWCGVYLSGRFVEVVI